MAFSALSSSRAMKASCALGGMQEKAVLFRLRMATGAPSPAATVPIGFFFSSEILAVVSDKIIFAMNFLQHYNNVFKIFYRVPYSIIIQCICCFYSRNALGRVLN